MLHKRQLDTLLSRVDNLRNEPIRPAVKKEDVELRNKIERLELLLEEREEALQTLQKKSESAEMMASRLESVQKEFDRVQDRLREVEQQARTASLLAVELEEVRGEYSRLQQEQHVRQQQLQELLNTNHTLNRQLSETEGRYQDADNQRQQYMKRARVMEDLNADYQSASESDARVRGELRRVGALQSMLNLIT
jgi:chromosome segregation ATPase